MKPLKGNQRLRSVSRSHPVMLQALEPKSSPRRRRGLDASTDRGLTERSGEVFSLDILSHRMSAMAMFQLSRSGDFFTAKVPFIRLRRRVGQALSEHTET